MPRLAFPAAPVEAHVRALLVVEDEKLPDVIFDRQHLLSAFVVVPVHVSKLRRLRGLPTVLLWHSESHVDRIPPPDRRRGLSSDSQNINHKIKLDILWPFQSVTE